LQEVEDLLAQVRLVESGNVRSSSYSGGMKRRLSVAIALIGDPKVVSSCFTALLIVMISCS
jgi:ABC-type multidrug transport system ATPase subunit